MNLDKKIEIIKQMRLMIAVPENPACSFIHDNQPISTTGIRWMISVTDVIDELFYELKLTQKEAETIKLATKIILDIKREQTSTKEDLR